jgi:hypothetical protein
MRLRFVIDKLVVTQKLNEDAFLPRQAGSLEFVKDTPLLAKN